MTKFKIGDKVTWNIQRGVNPEGIIIEIEKDYSEIGDTRYRVKTTKNLNFHSKYAGNITIEIGKILQLNESSLKKIKRAH